MFVVVPHMAGFGASVHVDIRCAAEVACSYPMGCRVVAVNSNSTDAPKWKEGLFAGPEHGTRLEDLRPAIVEGLRGLVDELATDG